MQPVKTKTNKSKRAKKAAKLLWVDLEMTGLDLKKDKIIEVAAIATDWQLNEVATYTATIKRSEKFLRRRMTGDFWEKNSFARRALIEQNAQGKWSFLIERELLSFIDKNFEDEVYLAGNSIHNDRNFIKRAWKRLDARLHYRMLDVTAWKIYFENVKKIKFSKPEEHRALDDVRGSIDEFKYYLKKIK